MVNGSVVDAMGVKVDPAQDQIFVDGKRIETRPQLRYLLLFKPVGYICSVHDDRRRRTVLDLLEGINERVYPVGRLDYDTSGLLLLTNDGEMTNQLLHPSHQVEKTYLAQVTGIPASHDLQRLREGIQSVRQGNAVIELQIHEGRNRQVRRMMDAIGHPVQRLRRTAVAFLRLEGLQPGQWRDLTAEEVARLKQL